MSIRASFIVLFFFTFFLLNAASKGKKSPSEAEVPLLGEEEKERILDIETMPSKAKKIIPPLRAKSPRPKSSHSKPAVFHQEAEEATPFFDSTTQDSPKVVNPASGDTFVHILCEDENLDVLTEYRQDAGWLSNMQPNTELDYPIHIVCRKGNLAIAKLLLDTEVGQATLYKRNGKGFFPFQLACKSLKPNSALIGFLLADINYSDLDVIIGTWIQIGETLKNPLGNGYAERVNTFLLLGKHCMSDKSKEASDTLLKKKLRPSPQRFIAFYEHLQKQTQLSTQKKLRPQEEGQRKHNQDEDEE